MKSKILFIICISLFLKYNISKADNFINQFSDLFSSNNNNYKIDYSIQKAPDVTIEDMVNL